MAIKSFGTNAVCHSPAKRQQSGHKLPSPASPKATKRNRTRVDTIDLLNNANLNGKAGDVVRFMHFPGIRGAEELLCDEGFVHKHSRRVHNRVFGRQNLLTHLFRLILSPIRPGVFVYLRYLNFIYSVCAFQMAYITLTSPTLSDACSCQNDVENSIKVPTRPRLFNFFFPAPLSCERFMSHRDENANGIGALDASATRSLPFYFPIFGPLKMQISIDSSLIPLRIRFLLLLRKMQAIFYQANCFPLLKLWLSFELTLSWTRKRKIFISVFVKFSFNLQSLGWKKLQAVRQLRSSQENLKLYTRQCHRECQVDWIMKLELT